MKHKSLAIGDPEPEKAAVAGSILNRKAVVHTSHPALTVPHAHRPGQGTAIVQPSFFPTSLRTRSAEHTLRVTPGAAVPVSRSVALSKRQDSDWTALARRANNPFVIALREALNAHPHWLVGARPSDAISALLTLAASESTFVHSAKNTDSSARGLLQTTDDARTDNARYLKLRPSIAEEIARVKLPVGINRKEWTDQLVQILRLHKELADNVSTSQGRLEARGSFKTALSSHPSAIGHLILAQANRLAQSKGLTVGKMAMLTASHIEGWGGLGKHDIMSKHTAARIPSDIRYFEFFNKGNQYA